MSDGPSSATLHRASLVRITNATCGLELARRAEVAASPWRRVRGLLGRPPLEPGQGLLIIPCHGVHTLGMSFPIDVVHLDGEGVVRAVLHHLEPWRIGPIVWRARMALELPAGTAATTQVGDRLSVTPSLLPK